MIVFVAWSDLLIQCSVLSNNGLCLFPCGFPAKSDQIDQVDTNKVQVDAGQAALESFWLQILLGLMGDWSQKSDFGWFVHNTCICHWSNWGSQPYIARLVHTVRSHLVTGTHPSTSKGGCCIGAGRDFASLFAFTDFSWFLMISLFVAFPATFEILDLPKRSIFSRLGSSKKANLFQRQESWPWWIASDVDFDLGIFVRGQHKSRGGSYLGLWGAIYLVSGCIKLYSDYSDSLLLGSPLIGAMNGVFPSTT